MTARRRLSERFRKFVSTWNRLNVEQLDTDEAYRGGNRGPGGSLHITLGGPGMIDAGIGSSREEGSPADTLSSTFFFIHSFIQQPISTLSDSRVHSELYPALGLIISRLGLLFQIKDTLHFDAPTIGQPSNRQPSRDCFNQCRRARKRLLMTPPAKGFLSKADHALAIALSKTKAKRPEHGTRTHIDIVSSSLCGSSSAPTLPSHFSLLTSHFSLLTSHLSLLTSHSQLPVAHKKLIQDL